MCIFRNILILFTIFFICFLISLTKNYSKPIKSFEKPIPVIAFTVNKRNIGNYIMAVGLTRPKQNVDISSEVSGVVKSVLFQSGQHVSAGQPLIVLDSSSLNGEYNKAKTKLELLKRNYARFSKLSDLKVYAKADLDKQKSDLEVAKADLQNIETSISKRSITAPFSGQLGISKINIGQFINQGEKIVNEADTSTLFVDFTIPESYAPNFNLNDPIILYLGENSEQRLIGKIIAKENQIDSATHTLKLLATIDNASHKLISGCFINIKLLLTNNETITIPLTAVVYRSDGTFVYKINSSHAHLTAIQLGEIFNNEVAVTSGINAGDIIVKNGQINLYDGALTKVIFNTSANK